MRRNRKNSPRKKLLHKRILPRKERLQRTHISHLDLKCLTSRRVTRMRTPLRPCRRSARAGSCSLSNNNQWVERRRAMGVVLSSSSVSRKSLTSRSCPSGKTTLQSTTRRGCRSSTRCASSDNVSVAVSTRPSTSSSATWEGRVTSRGGSTSTARIITDSAESSQI